METLRDFFNYELYSSEDIHITVKALLVVLFVIIVTSILLTILGNTASKKLPKEDRIKFKLFFSYGKWIIYLIILLIACHSVGINVTTIFAASAALLIGVGLALQTLFKDIIAGVLILIDQTLHVGDIIEIDGKVGRVEEIKLRTTRAVTIDNKVLIIPHHLYLDKTLYNWTQNGSETRENLTVGVAYGSDINKVKKILLKVANDHEATLKDPPPLILFTNFGDSSLDFKLIFTLNDSFQGAIPKSDMRFEIDRLFKENNITIPFPQRDIHIKQK